MGKGRLEAFSDGVFAIIITIMVLELRPPDGTTLDSLGGLVNNGLAYVLSYVNIGLYWTNHHHLLQAARTVDGRVLWANLFLLFWLSLFPFSTAWLGEHPDVSVPVATYGVVLFGAAIGYTILVRALIRAPGQDDTLARAIGRDTKGNLSLLLYATAIPAAFLLPAISIALFVIVAVSWSIPDRRIERILGR